MGSSRRPRPGSRGGRKEASFPLAVAQLSFSRSRSFVEQVSWAYLPVRHSLSSPVKDQPGQPGGGDGARRAQFTGRCIGLLKSHPSRRICRPGLLVTGTAFLGFLLSLFIFHLAQVCSICHLCGYLRTMGWGVAFYLFFLECDANHNGLQAGGGGGSRCLVKPCGPLCSWGWW